MPKLCVDGLRRVNVVLLKFSKLRHENSVVHKKCYLEVQPKTPHVEVNGTEQSDFTIDGDALGV